MSFQVSYIFKLADQISPNLQKIAANTRQFASQIKQSADKAAHSFKKLNNNIKSVSRKSMDMGKNLFLKTTAPIAGLGGLFIKAASDYEESLNKVDVAFGRAGGSVVEFAQSAGKNFGIDRGAALDMAAMFGDMSTAMGLSQNKAADMSKSLVGLAGDLASFKNIGVDQAQTALAAIFTGETESLKRLGVVMTETNLQQFALGRGFRGNLKDMKQSEKVLLRYNYVMEMTRNSHGDFVRTQKGFANQLRILGSRFRDLSIDIGTMLLPIATKMLGVMIKVIDKLRELSPTSKKVILVIAGLIAVLAPLLILFGALGLAASAIASGLAFAPVVAVLAGKFILLTGAAVALVEIFKEGYEWVTNFDNKLSNLIDNLSFLKKNFSAVWNEVRSLFGANIEAETQMKLNQELIDKVNAGKQRQMESAMSQRSIISNNQLIDASGNLTIGFKNAPQGTSANFTPKPGSLFDRGTMLGVQ